MKLTRIRPAVDDQGRVTLDMILASDKAETMVSALMAFDSNPIFGPVDPKGAIPPTQTDPLYRFALVVPYAQKL